MHNENRAFQWNFQRLGGLDQVVPAQAEEYRRLGELDPKLWVALSCPASGLALDERLLSLVDEDRDGRIRVPDVVLAVDWACARLRSPEEMAALPASLPLASIDDSREDGRRLLQTAKIMLEQLGKPEAGSLGPEEAEAALAMASESLFNGDGILPPPEENANGTDKDGLDPEMARFISEATSVAGGALDAGGRAGLSAELARVFMQTLNEWRDWHSRLRQAAAPLKTALKGDTGAAWESLRGLQEKIEDYFLRCDLAAYAPEAAGVLDADSLFDPAEAGGAGNLSGFLDLEALSRLPISRVEAGRSLDLDAGLNPAWREQVGIFAGLLAPLLRSRTLSREEWRELLALFAPYRAVMETKPARPAGPEPDFPPIAGPEDLGDARVDEILNSDLEQRFLDLAEEDLRTPAKAADFAEVERLTRYYCRLQQLLLNFLSFADFYAMNKEAAFQTGTLYLDGKSCDLCVPVQDVARHSSLAVHSRLFLVYCVCRRAPEPGQAENPSLTIAAAVTAGSDDLLLENRNGVYLDKHGRIWDATVIKVISNPISLRQAVFSPYQRLGRMISEQIQQFAGQKDAETLNRATTAVTGLPAALNEPPAAGGGAAPAKFDLGKNMGILAALGLALGAIGTALASLAGALVSLRWWQIPLVFLVIFLFISGPSVISAAIKLRQRTLGPLLEASGWAINGKVSITMPLGRALTGIAKKPPSGGQ